MLEAQGLRPLDPYRTLQLHPHAPRELIVEAYWALVARQKRRLATWPSAANLIGELNSAYGLLMDDEQRRAYDEEHGLTHLRAPHVRVTRKGFALLGFGAALTVVSDHADFYHLLRVDREADAEIVELAHAILRRRAAGHDVEDVFLRDLLDEAYHTLRIPQLRAQYDASLAGGTAKTAQTSRLPRAAPPALSQMAENVSVGAPAEVSKDLPVTLPATEPQLTAVPVMFSKAPGDAATSPAHEEDGSGRDVVAAGDADGAATGETAPRATRTIFHLIRLGERTNGYREGAAERPEATAPRNDRQADGTREAEDARTLTLRDAAMRLVDGFRDEQRERAVPPHLAARRTDAALIFTGGPRAGDRAPLSEETMTIGSGYGSDIVLAAEDGAIAPEHARVWKHGEHFVFHQLDGAGTMIGDLPLTLPLVMLDDGDEIQIGAHRMRFSRHEE